MIGGDGERPTVRGFRCFELSETMQHAAEIVVRVSEVAVERNGAFIAGERILRALLIAHRVAEVQPAECIGREPRGQFAQAFFRFHKFAAAGVAVSDRHLVLRFVGCQFAGALEGGERLTRSAEGDKRFAQIRLKSCVVRL